VNFTFRLRESLTALGLAFVKGGQALSIRPDILPPPAVY
jgi:predicted unusual protein kinase regulating ubiquinone biosynthesis (AarF/ABC1/UbiB family)